MKVKRIIIVAAALFMSLAPAFADEGMWMINTIDRALEKKMQKSGLQLDAKVIYDEDKVSLSDAVVALGFSCTGSMVSQDGLMITNHHCAYSDIHALSTPGNNYLEDGFWAQSRDEELPCKGQSVYFLKKMLDITSEVMALRDSFDVARKPMGMRRVYSCVEERYKKFFGGEGEVVCSSFYNGNKYYVAHYQVYNDVRLVAAPPVCIASFGGEVDNWEWPQHKGDFAIYRVYTAPDGSPAEYSPENVPLHPVKSLKISTKGVRPGDYTMVIGYPGRTNRYASSYAVEEITSIVNPIQAQFRGDQMKILEKWMDSDPEVRLKYADKYFGLSNVQEIREGEIYCYNRFEVVDIKRSQEQSLQKYLGNSDLIYRLGQKYEDVAWINQQVTYFQETLVRGTNMHRMVNAAKRGNTELVEREKAALDMRVERDLFSYSLGQFYKNVKRQFWGDYLTEVYDRFKGDRDAIVDEIWTNHLSEALSSCKITAFSACRDSIEAGVSKTSLEKQFKDEVYRRNLASGVPMYPDANSTMRITFGKVCDLQPRDAVTIAPQTTTKGILEKYDPDNYDFVLNTRIRTLLREHPAQPVDFLSDNDITGGNSGSPVLNARGELIGLAFDGNKESLAGDTYFDPEMNKCINVDIRYVVWILRYYARMDALLAELGL